MENKIALVTGASRGIGKAIAHELGLKGFTVVGTSTSESGANQISAEFEKNSIKGKGMVLNITDPSSIANTLSQIESEFGPIAVLVNNAGITQDNLLLRMKDEEWHSIIETNLTSIFRLSKAVLKNMMKARWGRIINIGSVVGSMGNAGQTNYSAAKAGLLGFTKSLAREIGSRNVTVNAVAPGMIDTDMTKALNDAQREVMLQQIPLGRLGQPQEIAKVVAFLAGEDASYITGETLHVNGGMFMC